MTQIIKKTLLSSLQFHVLPLAFIFLSTILFFLHLFYPEQNFFTTPDSYLSDILNFNYPLKHFLGESLKNNTLPLWTSELSNGYPLLAEAEIGTFSIINLILFRFLPTPMAFNIGYITTFFLLGVGMYFLSYYFYRFRTIALFCALIWEFCGFMAAQIPHWNHLQALAFFPFIFLVVHRYIHRVRHSGIIFLPILVSQQIFCGHYQYVFMTWIVICIYFGLELLIHKKLFTQFVKENIMLFIFTAIGLGISAIQLAPSVEFFLQSSRNSIIQINALMSASMTFDQLLQYINPYISGDIRNGTYNIMFYTIWYWETIGFIGRVPFILAIVSIIYSKDKEKTFLFFSSIVLLLLFTMGDNSPIHFLFSFAPFSMFRMHSRFIVFISFFLILAAGNTLLKFYKGMPSKNIHIPVTVFILVLSADLFYFSYTYNPSLPIQKSLGKPVSLSAITDPNVSVYSYHSDKFWFSYFTKYGWKYPQDYLYLQNSAVPNFTLTHHTKNISTYSGFDLKRKTINANLISSFMPFSISTMQATPSGDILKLLNLQGVGYIISPYTIEHENLKAVKQITPPNERLPTFTVYKLDAPKNRFYLSSWPVTIPSYFSLTRLLSKQNKFTADALLSVKTIEKSAFGSVGKLTLKLNTPVRSILETQASTPAYLVGQIYSYPGWKATIDGKKTEIFIANIIGSAILVPAGKHTIEFTFIPQSLYIGAFITVAFLLLYGKILLYRRIPR